MEIFAWSENSVYRRYGFGKEYGGSPVAGAGFADGGELSFDGIPAETLGERRLRENISCVLQRDTIFSGTIRENVLAGREVEDTKVLRAGFPTRSSSILRRRRKRGWTTDDPARRKPFGRSETELAIARALLKPAAIYIFDDSFSALDFLTESRLRACLAERLKGKTQIIVTQRVTTAMNCDKIYVFDGGRIDACGTHEELMRSCGIYREIYLSQTRRSAPETGR